MKKFYPYSYRRKVVDATVLIAIAVAFAGMWGYFLALAVHNEVQKLVGMAGSKYVWSVLMCVLALGQVGAYIYLLCYAIVRIMKEERK